MRRIVFVMLFLTPAMAALPAGLRAPSCEALTAFAMGARLDPVEISFGKPADAMTMDEFELALDMVSVCLDEVEVRPPDVPGLLTRERKQSQLVALTQFAEDLRLYRNRKRERERAARRAD